MVSEVDIWDWRWRGVTWREWEEWERNTDAWSPFGSEVDSYEPTINGFEESVIVTEEEGGGVIGRDDEPIGTDLQSSAFDLSCESIPIGPDLEMM